MMRTILAIPVLALALAALGCVPVPQADALKPRELDIRPPVELVLGLGHVADMLDTCAPLAVSGPLVALRYEEKSPPDADTLEWVMTIHAPYTSSPAKTAECIREILIGAGGVELPGGGSSSDTGGSESGSSSSSGTTG